MPDLLLPLCRVQAVLLIGLVAAQADAQVPSQAAMEPMPGLHVSYERFGPEGIATPPGRFDGALATPLGTLRTSVHAVPAGEQHFQRGDTSFEWAAPVLGGQLQLRDLQAGGTAAAWRTRLDAGLTAKTECDWTPARSGQALQLTQDLGDGHVAQALLSTAKTAAGQGARWDFEILQAAGGSRWNAGIEAAEEGYVSAAGAQEARAGVRVGTQLRLFPHAWMEARYALQLRGDVQEPASWVMVGTRFDLPRRVSLATSVETDANAYHKASLTLAMPLELR
jgi:hypothetical protein